MAMCLALAVAAAGLAGESGAAQETVVGPPRGSLVIVGGALRDPEIVRAFIQRAGGPDAPIVIVPTAGGGDDADYGPWCRCLGQLRAQGATNLTVLHTYDPDIADTEAFSEPLREARGVWFTGGRQWRLADAYLGTRTEEAFRAVLDRGGVIGGSSAGASIQGSYLARGDTRTNTTMMGDHEIGFGYLRDTAIDQHLLARNRQFDMLEIVEARPELLGIGIDEDTAILVDGDRFEVMGRGYVAIYDAGSGVRDGGPFYFLRDGDRFDLSTRTPARPDSSFGPLDRFERIGGSTGNGGGR
ncbi:MAG: cyanophycinase [Gemmatimonadetes bacterium]|nr:cyanophycinase [Gemmatimonadota bacterium]